MVQAEAPDVPSVRTGWSAHNKKELGMWWSCTRTLQADAQAFRPGARRLVLFGDSITESWRGSSYGKWVK